ncbi:MAG TPA: ParB/RepB/Spo0J family partition protein [Tepidisphaeraceae bacterium]|jgi:ParB family chromosome partitioning protein
MTEAAPPDAPETPPVTPANAPAAVSQDLSDERLTQISLDQIDVNPHQPRQKFDPAALDTLADSIRANGVIQPIIVRLSPSGRYQLVAGERRLRAAKLAKLSDIPAVVRKIDDYTQAQWALVENIHREDLNPMDRAEAYATLLQQLGLTQAELAGRLGEQRSSVANYLRLLDLDTLLRDDLRAGLLSFGHAKVLAGIPSAAEQLRLAELVKTQHLSIRNLERLVERGQSAPPPAPDTEADGTLPARLHLQEVEQQMVQQLGLRVQLRGGKKSGTGKVVIHYRSLEEFDDLVRRCGIQLSSE